METTGSGLLGDEARSVRGQETTHNNKGETTHNNEREVALNNEREIARNNEREIALNDGGSIRWRPRVVGRPTRRGLCVVRRPRTTKRGDHAQQRGETTHNNEREARHSNERETALNNEGETAPAQLGRGRPCRSGRQLVRSQRKSLQSVAQVHA